MQVLSTVPQHEMRLLEERSPKTLFVLKDGSLSEHIISLLKLTELYDERDSLAQVVEKTQSIWISVIQGRGNKERTDLTDSPERALLASKVELCAQEMGLLQKKPPLLQHYTYGVCHGTFLDGVRSRLSLLIQAWEEGIRFDTLVFLTGERYLRNKEGETESLFILCNPSEEATPLKKNWHFQEGTPYATEYDMVKIVWDQVEIPENMKKALEGKIVFINAPKGTHERPSTKDTFAEWLKSTPQPGTILAFSDPLVWAQQQIVGETAIRKKNLALDTTSKALSPDQRKRYGKAMTSLVLDTVAKCLFEISIGDDARAPQ